MDKQMSYGEDYKYIFATSTESGKGTEVLPDLYCHTVQIVNIILVGHPYSNEFVLVDAGMPYSAKKIISVIEKRFGVNQSSKSNTVNPWSF